MQRLPKAKAASPYPQLRVVLGVPCRLRVRQAVLPLLLVLPAKRLHEGKNVEVAVLSPAVGPVVSATGVPLPLPPVVPALPPT
jgi:hypothetical protein